MARKDALLRLHKTLIGRRNDLLKRLGMELNDLKNEAASGDSADAAFDSGSEEMASKLAELESSELMQIERALEKLRQGTYGLCEVCQQRIPIIRLNALPYTTLCIACQREMESDSSWLDRQQDVNWDKVSDDNGDDAKEIDLSDLEMDMTK